MNLPIDLSYWATAGGIVLIDLVLSGDNALIIGAAASRLPRGQRLVAIIWGGLLAIVFRMLLAIVATELLHVSYLRTIGGVILLVIAIRLLVPEGADNHERRGASSRLIPAILTILAADATMSLDNVLAVGALADRHIDLLVAGLLLSMLLLFVASALIARVIDLMPILMDVAAVVLAWTAANLVVDDTQVVNWVSARLALPDQWQLYLHLIFVALILLADLFIRLVILPRRQRRATARAATPKASDGAEAVGAVEAQAAPVTPGTPESNEMSGLRTTNETMNETMNETIAPHAPAIDEAVD